MSKEGRALSSAFKPAGKPGGEPAAVDLRKLAVLARQAYEQKRTKHCLALTKALLLFDPHNAEALSIQAAIRSDVQRDLGNARALTADVRDTPETSRKAAEDLISNVLSVEPENEEAKSLLSKITRPSSEQDVSNTLSAWYGNAWPSLSRENEASEADGNKTLPVSSVHVESASMPLEQPEPQEVVWSPPPHADWSTDEVQTPLSAVAEKDAVIPPPPSPRVAWSAEDAQLTLTLTPEPAAPATSTRLHTETREESARKASMYSSESESLQSYANDWPADSLEPDGEGLTGAAEEVLSKPVRASGLRRMAIPLGIAAVLAFGGILLLVRQRGETFQPSATSRANGGGAQQSAPTAAPPAPLAGAAGMAGLGEDDVLDPFADPQQGALSEAPPEAPPEPPAPAPPAVTPAPVVTGPMGKLALSSPTSVEIYRNGEFLGSTPISLDLPPGSHTLEYRHQDMSNVVTHVVRSNETTRAMVTFEMTMKINARPWAQVFVDGATRRPLGQTPLSDVRVPIGSTLVFRHPNFPEKSYRVTGKDTAVQMVFP